MTQAVAVQAPSFTLVPSSYDDALKISQTLAKSQLVPKDYQGKPENIFVAIAWGQELGLAPLQALQGIAVINGRPSLWGDAALAVVRAHPEFEDIIETLDGEGDRRVATCTIKRRGQEPTVVQFSVSDAKTASLWHKSGPWTQYPERMLQMRARGFAMRDAFTDALKGFKTAEEVQDIEELDVTPPARPAVVMPKASAKAKAEEPKQETKQAPVEDAQVVEEQPQGQRTEPAQDNTPEPAEGVQTLSTGQLKVIRSKLENGGIAEADLAEHFNVLRLEAIPAADVNKALDWIKERGK